eukprot:12437584-Alexandrium_andersonii.AAC.1
MSNRVDDRRATTAHIPVYDVLALAGVALAMRHETDPSGQASQGLVVLRPAMSFQHEVISALHGNIQTSLR